MCRLKLVYRYPTDIMVQSIEMREAPGSFTFVTLDCGICYSSVSMIQQVEAQGYQAVVRAEAKGQDELVVNWL